MLTWLSFCTIYLYIIVVIHPVCVRNTHTTPHEIDMTIHLRRLLLLVFTFLLQLAINAQSISRKYVDVPMSHVMADINSATPDYDLYFIHDELEVFPVTCQFKRLPIIDAIKKVIGFYPVKMTITDHRIFLECTQKRSAIIRGKIIGHTAEPIPYASVILSHPQTRKTINTGISNESGKFSVPCDSMTIAVRINCLGYKPFTGVFKVGDIGTIRLQPATYQLHPVEVTQRRGDKPRVQKAYHRRAEKVREKVWGKRDSCFQTTTVPDSLLAFPEIVIAQSYDQNYKRKFLFKPWHLLGSHHQSPLGTYRTNTIALHRQRILLNEEQTADKYAMLEYPRETIMSDDPDKEVVMGVKVIKPDGTEHVVETDEYTQPLGTDERFRPKYITVSGLESGDIIDYFIWTETKTSTVNPEPVLMTIDRNCPQLSCRFSAHIDKNLNAQYRLLNEADTLQQRSDTDGKTLLSAHYKNLMPMRDKERGYALYVRDEEMKVNAPLSATGNHVAVNPAMQDVLTTRMGIYDKMKTMCDTKTWTVNSWNETDTTVVSALVTNLARKTNSQELLTEALYYQTLRFPTYLVYKHHTFDGCIDNIFLNREYTIMFAHMLQHAGIPFQMAMTTMNDKEGIDQLMDENNIVWMIRTNNGQCFIPRFDGFTSSNNGATSIRGMAQQFVGQKAQLIDGSDTFVICN